MRRIEAKVIAKIMCARVIDQFDLYAFDGCDDIITESEREKIIKEIKREGDRLLSFAKKYGVDTNNHSTKDIIESVLFD